MMIAITAIDVEVPLQESGGHECVSQFLWKVATSRTPTSAACRQPLDRVASVSSLNVRDLY